MASDWKQSLDEETHAKSVRLIEMMEQAGASDAELWVQSEIQEDIPQVARYLLLRNIGIDAMNRSDEYLKWLAHEISNPKDSRSTTMEAVAALKSLLDASVNKDDIGKIARYVIEQAIFRTLVVIDNGYDDWHEGLTDEAPGWAMAELDAEGELTG